MATPAQVGTRVRQERNRLGLSERALAVRSGLSQPRIHRIETDPQRPIDLGDLSKIAAGLGVSMSSLIEDSPVRDRVFAAARARDDGAVADALYVACNLIELEERLSGLGVGDRQQLRLPQVRLPAEGPAAQGCFLAHAVRELWEIPDAPLGDIGELIEDFTGADVAVRDLPDDVSGLAVTEQTAGVAVILANTQVSREHQRFTLAHELGHLLTGDTQVDTARTSSTSPAERRANSFAGHLLMPEGGVRRWLAAAGDPPVTAERTVAALARVFGASLDVTLIQLQSFGLITASQKSALGGVSMRTLALRHGWLSAWEAGAAAAAGTRPPRRLWQRALLAYQSGQLGIAPLALLAHTDPARMRAELAATGVVPQLPAPVPIDFDALLARAAT